MATSKIAGRARRLAGPEPVVIYMGRTLDGTAYGLDPVSQRRIREAFPGVRVSRHQVFIGQDTQEAFEDSFGRFEDQVVILLTGVSAEQLAEHFGYVSFRAPGSHREVGRLPAQKARAARRA